MPSAKQYVIGKGRVFFNQFAPGTKTPTSERYLGNTPELSTTSDQETLDHYDADAGLNVKDESVIIESNVTGSLVTDNIDIANVAAFFGGDVDDVTVAGATGLSDTFTAKRGHYLQLGTSPSNPSGVRGVTNVVVKIGASTITMLNNYEVELDLGRVFIEDEAPGIDDGDTLIVEYDVSAGTRQTIIGKGVQLAGSLRFISANPIGGQKDYYWPYVKLSPNGDFNLKGDEWQSIPFTFEVLKLDATTERLYIDGRAA